MKMLIVGPLQMGQRGVSDDECAPFKLNSHFSLWGVLGARDVELIQADVIAVHFLNDEHLETYRLMQAKYLPTYNQ